MIRVASTLTRSARPVIFIKFADSPREKSRQTGRKYYRPISLESLSGAAFRAMTGRTVNPQVPGSSPGRGANIQTVSSARAAEFGNIPGNIFSRIRRRLFVNQE